MVVTSNSNRVASYIRNLYKSSTANVHICIIFHQTAANFVHVAHLTSSATSACPAASETDSPPSPTYPPSPPSCRAPVRPSIRPSRSIYAEARLRTAGIAGNVCFVLTESAVDRRLAGVEAERNMTSMRVAIAVGAAIGLASADGRLVGAGAARSMWDSWGWMGVLGFGAGRERLSVG